MELILITDNEKDWNSISTNGVSYKGGIKLIVEKESIYPDFQDQWYDFENPFHLIFTLSHQIY